jgi:hypothetical protein
MFTFGREHEKKCALAYVRKRDQAALVSTMIDAIHDLLEGNGTADQASTAIGEAFVNGGSGVWEGAGSWLRKTCAEYPGLRQLWAVLARHESAVVRFRVACFLNDMPHEEFAFISSLLLNDKSKKVAAMARTRAEEVALRVTP